MRILHVTETHSTRGGVEQYLLSVGALLEERGHHNAVLCRAREPVPSFAQQWPVHLLGAEGLEAEARVRQVIETERPDVAYIHHIGSAAVVEALVHLLPTLAYVHGFPALCPGLAKYFRRDDRICERAFGWACAPLHYVRRCSSARNPLTLYRLISNTARLKRALLSVPRLLVASPYMERLLAQNGFSRDRITVLAPHLICRPPALAADPPDEPKTVLYAGRLEIEKGVPYLLRAFARLRQRATLLIAGDGTLRPIYEQLAAELGLGDRVTFIGWLDPAAMVRVYRRCALLVMPSICPEAFGKVGVEATMQARPVVAFDVGGISSWLVDGVNGFLVPPRDVAALAAGIDRLLADDHARQSMGLAGQALVTERFAAEAHYRTLVANLDAVRGCYGSR